MVGRLLLLLLCAAAVQGQTGENVLLVWNRADASSREIAQYYRPRRSVPIANVCALDTPPAEEIDWNTYQQQIERPIAECLKKAGLVERVLYIVTTLGVPLKIHGGGTGWQAEHASVDSELTLLYSKLKGAAVPRAGGLPNPLFGKRGNKFEHPQFPIYLVTRLAAFDAAEVKAMIDRALAAQERGKVVLDLRSANNEPGNDWLRTAAMLLPATRAVLEESARVLTAQKDVIGYASWGSNDSNRKQRFLGFEWRPGAIVTEFVSTNARTFQRPPDNWSTSSWNDSKRFFMGSPQNLSADALHEGATGVSGNVYEPYLAACARPDYLFPTYLAGRNLAESYYVALPFLSWQGVVLGDPLCVLRKP